MKLYHDLRRQYYWSGMKKHVGDFVRQCLICQQVKFECQRLARLLQPVEVGAYHNGFYDSLTTDIMRA